MAGKRRERGTRWLKCAPEREGTRLKLLHLDAERVALVLDRLQRRRVKAKTGMGTDGG